MDTSHWLTILLFVLGGFLTMAQAVFWFLIRNLQQADRELSDHLAALNQTVNNCQRDHLTTGVSRGDFAELRAAVSAVHKRLDQILILMIRTGIARPEEILGVEGRE